MSQSKILPKGFTSISMIGQGAQGIIYLAKDSNNQNVAIKKIATNSNIKQMVMNEYTILHKLKEYREKTLTVVKTNLSQNDQNNLEKSKHLLQLLQPVINEEDNTYFILKYYEQSINFSNFLKLYHHQLSERQLLVYYHQILLGLSLLHAQQIYHRDLKPENILYCPQENHLVIIDFGSAVFKKSEDSGVCGSKLFASPQVNLCLIYSPEKNDIWAMGIILYYLTHKGYPFCSSDSGQDEFQKNIADFYQEKKDIAIDPNVSPIVRQLLKVMLMRNEQGRPSIDEVLRRLTDYLYGQKPTSFKFQAPTSEDAEMQRKDAQSFKSVLDIVKSKVENTLIKNTLQAKPLQYPSSNQSTLLTQEKNPQQPQNDQIGLSGTPIQHLVQEVQGGALVQPYTGNSYINFTNNGNNRNNNNNNNYNNNYNQNYNLLNPTSQNNNNNINNFSNNNMSYRSQLQQSFISSRQSTNFTDSGRPSTQPPYRKQITNSLLEELRVKINQTQLLMSPTATRDMINECKQEVIEIDTMIKDVGFTTIKPIKQLLYFKFYLSKLSHFLSQSLVEFYNYQSGKDYLMSYTSNFLVSIFNKGNQSDITDQYKQINYTECVEFCAFFKPMFEQALKDLATNLRQSQQEMELSMWISTRISETPKEYEEYRRSIIPSSTLDTQISFNQSSAARDAQTRFKDHADTLFPMANSSSFLNYIQQFLNILKYIQRKKDENFKLNNVSSRINEIAENSKKRLKMLQNIVNPLDSLSDWSFS